MLQNQAKNETVVKSTKESNLLSKTQKITSFGFRRWNSLYNFGRWILG